MPGKVILGAQWGDEGKGKFIDIAVRFNGNVFYSAGKTGDIADKRNDIIVPVLIYLSHGKIFRSNKGD